jgi:hypothetical protein
MTSNGIKRNSCKIINDFRLVFLGGKYRWQNSMESSSGNATLKRTDLFYFIFCLRCTCVFICLAPNKCKWMLPEFLNNKILSEFIFFYWRGIFRSKIQKKKNTFKFEEK